MTNDIRPNRNVKLCGHCGWWLDDFDRSSGRCRSCRLELLHVDPFFYVSVSMGFRVRIAMACGATGLPRPLEIRARAGERGALRLLSKLIARRSDLSAHDLVTGEEIAALLAGRPMGSLEWNARFAQLAHGPEWACKDAVVLVGLRERRRRLMQSSGGMSKRGFPDRIMVADIACKDSAETELQLLPEREETALPTASYVLEARSG
jgi:hypothetical protein